MDIQFILDAYACCRYIINYINKSNRGVSRLLREAMDEINAGNFSIKRKLQHIGNKFVNGTEISAQEAAYNILGLHLSEASHGEVFINTSHPDSRVRMVKQKRELEQLHPDSNDIFVHNIVDHYAQRPDELENLCLADFVANFNYKKRNGSEIMEQNYNELEDDDERNCEFGQMLRLKNNSGYIKKRGKPHIIRWRRFSPETSRPDYFREMRMLFFPWRCEQTDVVHANNERICFENSTIIEENKNKYNVFEEAELQSLLREIFTEDNVNINDALATQALDDEFRALAVPEVDRNINVLADNNRIEINDDETIRLIKLPPILTEGDLLIMVRSLNRKQRQYYAHVMHNFTNKSVFHEFVGGGAGVGKSRLISVLYQSLTVRANSIAGSNPELPKVFLCAPTGKAAFGISGLTLHSLFSLPVTQSAFELRPLSSDVVNGMYAKFMELRVIVIDEISMVGAKMFAHLDARLKQIFKSKDYFGGISVIVFGDLKQLPPVGDRWIFLPNRNDAYSVITGTPLWDRFKYFELTEIMRQRKDQSFAVALNNMSEGRMTEEDIELLRQRVVAESTIPREVIHLFYGNADVDSFNATKLAEINSEEFVSTAKDTIKASTLSDRSKQKILEAVKSFNTSETQGLKWMLQLKTTAKYMITININTLDGLVNGASGELMQIDRKNIGESLHITGIWIKFLDDSVGIIARSKQPHSIHADWTKIEKIVRPFQYKKNEQVSIERKQFPVVPAEAITIHKSQGATYKKVAVHIKSKMTRSALYVACSRATNASGLFIIGEFSPPRPFGDNDLVKMELSKLRCEKILKTRYELLLDRNGILLFYQNVQSLPLHLNDIQSDDIICSADILCFVETWAFQGEEFFINGFCILRSINGPRRTGRGRPANGIMVFVRDAIRQDVHVLFEKTIYRDGTVFQLLSFRYMDTSYIVVYRNSRLPTQDFRKEILENVKKVMDEQEGHIVIVGDFNICRLTETDRLETELQHLGLCSLLNNDSTTKQLTQIDWIFSNDQARKGLTYETAFSHHEGIFCLKN